MHPDGFCCCLQASCQLRLRWPPEIFIFQLAATEVNDCWETRGQKSQTFQPPSSTNQVREFMIGHPSFLLSVFYKLFVKTLKKAEDAGER